MTLKDEFPNEDSEARACPLEPTLEEFARQIGWPELPAFWRETQRQEKTLLRFTGLVGETVFRLSFSSYPDRFIASVRAEGSESEYLAETRFIGRSGRMAGSSSNILTKIDGVSVPYAVDEDTLKQVPLALARIGAAAIAEYGEERVLSEVGVLDWKDRIPANGAQPRPAP